MARPFCCCPPTVKYSTMKLAVGLAGQYREHDTARASWGPLRDLGADFYMSTWRTTPCAAAQTRVLDREEIASAGNFVCVDLHDETRYQGLAASDKHVFHIKQVMQRMASSTTRYDVIVLTRPDAWLEFGPGFNDFIHNIGSGCIYTEGEVRAEPAPSWLYVHDVLLIGQPASMLAALSTLPFPLPKDSRGRLSKNIHFHLAVHFIINNIDVRNYRPHVESAIVRDNAAGKVDISLADVHELSRQWWEQHHSYGR